MKKSFNVISFIILILSLVFSITCKNNNISENVNNQNSQIQIKKPFPQHTTYGAGIIKPDNRTQDELDSDVKNFYNEWKKRYLREVTNEKGPNGEKTYKIIVDSSGRTVSEGQGYGMVILALMAGYEKDAKEIFDGLWYFSRNHKSKIDDRLMAWEVPEPEGGTDSAFDGDCDIAYALLLADAQWGSKGKVNYFEEAKKVITAIRESTIGKDSYLPLLGDWVDQNGDKYNQYTPRTSDFMIINFRAFYKATKNSFWNKVIKNIQKVISIVQNNYSRGTGLLPDFLQGNESIETLRPADENFLESEYDGDYYYNAGRDPWRIGLDVIINNNKTSKKEIKKILNWIYEESNGSPYKIKSGYHLNGEPLKGSDYFTTFFVSPFGVAAMTDSTKQAFLNKIYNSVRAKFENYYEDTVNLICLIIMSGNYWTY